MIKSKSFKCSQTPWWDWVVPNARLITKSIELSNKKLEKPWKKALTDETCGGILFMKAWNFSMLCMDFISSFAAIAGCQKNPLLGWSSALARGKMNLCRGDFKTPLADASWTHGKSDYVCALYLAIYWPKFLSKHLRVIGSKSSDRVDFNCPHLSLKRLAEH